MYPSFNLRYNVMLIKMRLITLFRVMNHHQKCLQANVKNCNEPKTGNGKESDLRRSQEIKVIGTFDCIQRCNSFKCI